MKETKLIVPKLFMDLKKSQSPALPEVTYFWKREEKP